MRKTIFIYFVALIAAAQTVWADEVTPEEALWLAQNFMQNHEATGSSPRKAQAATPQLTPNGQICGLYIFNVADDGGYVIVSNDDRTIPILGFSDSGSIDPDNIPDNMRAWLQGYADEIAGMPETALNDQTTNSPNNQSKARRKVGTHSTTPITPLITTTWNQSAPYNNLCPMDEINGGRSVTGCVATAMAQVMKYHQWPTTSTAIPGFTCSTLGNKTLDALPATTFDWTNMIKSYKNSYSDAEAAAVATLMQYCGWSVKMMYSAKVSSAYGHDVVTALKNYFGYKTTVQDIVRSRYSYADWTNLIYNELSQRRPVVYCGQSADGGHCFVCDGYQYEGSTDLFHMNWGWGGTSDGYFVLSVLNPNEQGIGGSVTNSAFNAGQEAIVGIQKPSDEGTVLNVPAIDINLTVNSVTVSSATIALGESVTVTANVTNNSTISTSGVPVVYDGDLSLVVGGSLDIFKMFLIPAGGTQDCSFTYTPQKTGTLSINVAAPNNLGSFNTNSGAAVSLTVIDQTPASLTASNITSESATLGWTNVGGATKWNLRYRPMSLTPEDFNAGSPTGWERYNLKTGDNTWRRLDAGGIDDSPCYASASYEKGEDKNPRYGLATPEITFGGIVSFYAWGEDEHFIVAYTTSGNKFYSISNETVATNEPKLYSYSTDALSGTGRIVIFHLNSEGHTSDSFLYVDNVTLVTPSADWTTVNNVTNPYYTLSGLSAAPNYEAQVQADYSGGGNWSDPVFFTSTSLELLNNDQSAGTKNTSLIAKWDGFTANVTLSGRTLWKDGDWNTLCLPFDMTAAQVTAQLAPTALKTLSSTSFADGTLTMNFEDATVIEAGKPYIIKWTEGSNLVAPNFTGVTIECTMNPAETVNVDFVGTYSSVTFESGKAFKNVLFLGGGNKLYYPDGAAATNIGACRGYFQLNGITAGDPSSPVKAFKLNFDGEDDPDGIVEIQNSKFEIQNEADAIYNLAGQRVTPHRGGDGGGLQKGIYIYNGRKVLK